MAKSGHSCWWQNKNDGCGGAATATYGIEADGTRIDFTLTTETLRVVRWFEVTATMETRIVLDFDLNRSLTQQGTQGWRMNPVIGQTLVEEVEDDESVFDQEGELSSV